ncbi:MAG TPA: hypothetical protein VFN61_03885 [Acidimicrobiales bacterium]|nr:hypothetical protein [Acidimicrobiales bacterium]
MGRLVAFLISRGLRKGLLGGSKAWLGIGGVAFGLRFAWRVLRRKPEIAFSEKLRPGERLIIAHRGDDNRRRSRGGSLRPARSGHNGRRESPAAKP